MQDVLQDVFHDALPMIPFLFLTYLLMEYLEHKSNDRLDVYKRQVPPDLFHCFSHKGITCL